MKPIGIFKYSVPIEIGGCCLCNCRILAVVNANRRALRNALFKIVDSYPVTAPYYFFGIYPEISQSIYRCLTYRMLGQLCHIGAVYTEICKRNRNIRLAPPKVACIPSFCKSLSYPTEESLNIISPKVITLLISVLSPFFKRFLYKKAAADCRHLIKAQKFIYIAAVNAARRDKPDLRKRCGKRL